MTFGLPERLWDKIQIDDSTECFIWTASKTREKHPNFSWQGKTVSVVRFIWKFLVGDLTRRELLWSVCPNRTICVNPAHKIKISPKEMVRLYDSPALENILKEICPRCGDDLVAFTSIKTKITKRMCFNCHKKNCSDNYYENNYYVRKKPRKS